METVNFMAKRFKTVGYTFVGKLYHCAVNHPSGLRLNKKANYLANQVKIYDAPPGIHIQNQHYYDFIINRCWINYLIKNLFFFNHLLNNTCATTYDKINIFENIISLIKELQDSALLRWKP
jgi:hypothetical protein